MASEPYHWLLPRTCLNSPSRPSALSVSYRRDSSVPDTNAAEIPPTDMATRTTGKESERMITGTTGRLTIDARIRLHLRLCRSLNAPVGTSISSATRA